MFSQQLDCTILNPRFVYNCTTDLIALRVQTDFIDEMYLHVPINSKRATVSINGVLLTKMTSPLSVPCLYFRMMEQGTSKQYSLTMFGFVLFVFSWIASMFGPSIFSTALTSKCVMEKSLMALFSTMSMKVRQTEYPMVLCNLRAYFFLYELAVGVHSLLLRYYCHEGSSITAVCAVVIENFCALL